MKTLRFGLSSLATVTLATACLAIPLNKTTAADLSLPTGGPAAIAPGAPALSYGVNEVVKMYKGGIGKEVILNYINATALLYRMNADEIIYLKSQGLPQDVMQAMITRSGQLQQQEMMANAAYAAGQQAASSQAYPAQGAPQVVMPTTPAPAVADYGADYAYPSYPYYSSYWPYGYGYAYWPSWGGGWGWGRGWYGRGFFGGFRGGFGGGFGGFRGGFGGFHGGGGGFRGGIGGFHGGGGGGGGHGGGGHR